MLPFGACIIQQRMTTFFQYLSIHIKLDVKHLCALLSMPSNLLGLLCKYVGLHDIQTVRRQAEEYLTYRLSISPSSLNVFDKRKYLHDLQYNKDI